MKRKPLTPEHRKKISEKLSGENSYLWVGDSVGYRGIHDWVRKHLGRATHCSNVECKYPRKNSSRQTIKHPKRFEWANKDHKYRRVLEDYMSMCTSCHRLYDYANHLSNKGSGTGSIKNKI
jgi:hypothetical protein